MAHFNPALQHERNSMAQFTYSEIEGAYFFVSGEMYGMNTALLCKDTGKILLRSPMAGIDEIEEDEKEEDDHDPGECVKAPHKNDLNLGIKLILEFVEEYMPDEEYTVRNIFKKRGAYPRYKNLLLQRDLLQQWYDFEHCREETALRKWCKENDIELKEEPTPS